MLSNVTKAISRKNTKNKDAISIESDKPLIDKSRPFIEESSKIIEEFEEQDSIDFLRKCLMTRSLLGN